jgi:hypothetical protein
MSAHESEIPISPSVPATDHSSALRTLGWSSFALALLQNICAALLAINGIRVAIGVGAVATAIGIWPRVLAFHADAIRIPMMSIALLGAVINLFALWQIRRLRNRPSAQWRKVPLNSAQKRSEHLQLTLSIVTLVLLAVEYTLHHRGA